MRQLVIRTSRKISASMILAVLLMIGALLVSAEEWDDSCWVRGYVPPGLSGETGGANVLDIEDDNGRLYVAGAFTYAGGIPVNYIAMWDGTEWHALDDGAAGTVAEIEHNGVHLFAAGDFGVGSPSIAKWNGSSWWAVGEESEVFNSYIEDIYYRDGDLFAAGSFTYVGDEEIWRVAEFSDLDGWHKPEGWCGFTWYNMNYGSVNDLINYRGDLWAGGDFTYCYYNDIYYLGRYVDEVWQWPVAMGTGFNDRIDCLYDHGGALWIGGRFNTVDGDPSLGMAVWSGGLSAINDENGADHYVNDFSALPDHWLCVATDASVRAFGRDYPGIPMSWHDIYGDIKVVETLTHMGNELYAGGSLRKGNETRDGIARWDGSGWRRLGNGLARNHTTVPDYVNCFELFADGLVAGGYFDISAVSDDGIDSHNIGFFDGEAWLPLNSGFVDQVLDLIVYDGYLFACGKFDYTASPHATPCNHIAQWNITTEAWMPLGDGLNGNAHALCEWDDLLIVGGDFSMADGVAVENIAAWDGHDFTPLGAGCNGTVRAVTTFNGDLVAAGQFTSAGGVTANRVAVWDGETWAPLGSGIDNGYVATITYHDGDLYAGGSFTAAEGSPAACIARWTGSEWVEVGGGVADGLYGTSVEALYNLPPDGLYVGGFFSLADGTEANGVALWRNDAWLPLGSGVSEGCNRNGVKAFQSYATDLMLGGDFKYAGSTLSASIARWDGDLTPVFMAGFTATPAPDGVHIDWRTAANDATYEFRLYGRLNDTRWSVDFERTGSGEYTAIDTVPAAGLVNYELHGREGDEGWSVLWTESVTLSVQQPVLPQVAVYPNPGNPSFRLGLELPVAGQATVGVYDVQGRHLATLLDESVAAGDMTLDWNGCDDEGRALSAGVYLVRLSTAAGTSTQRAVILR
ncbi:MAG: T9SS type A sorting domain-containing protein [bacterium]|nr:T9SS type A sorting domain-containing protein [bacterium]